MRARSVNEKKSILFGQIMRFKSLFVNAEFDNAFKTSWKLVPLFNSRERKRVGGERKVFRKRKVKIASSCIV